MNQSCYAMMVTKLGGPEVMSYADMAIPTPKKMKF